MIFAALAAGCSILPASPGRADVYDFGPGLTAVPAAPAGQEQTPQRAPIALTNITNTGSPGGSSALFYRLAYANAQQLRPYAQARWSQPPAQLLQQALRDRLSQGRVVLLGEDGAAQRVEGGWPTVLRVELEEFSQVFSAPQASVGLVRLRASVARAASSGGDRLLGQRVFVVQRPAATQDAAGGAHALAEASAEAADELAQWLEQSGW